MSKRVARQAATDANQKIDKAFARAQQVARENFTKTAPLSTDLDHTVLTESLFQATWDGHYLPYRKGSTILAPLGANIPTATVSTQRRGQRKRKACRRWDDREAGSDDDADGSDSDLNSKEEPDQLVKSTQEQKGHHFVDQTKTLVGKHVTINLLLQEALIHITLNHGNHQTDLSYKAIGLLHTLLKDHPPCRLHEGDVLVLNANLWEPVTRRFNSDWHADLMPFRDGFEFFYQLVQAVHDSAMALASSSGGGGVAGAATGSKRRSGSPGDSGSGDIGSGSGGGAGGSRRGGSAEAGGGSQGDGAVGQALLLEYFIDVFQQDLDARLALSASQGFKTSTHVQNSLAFRMMDSPFAGKWICVAPSKQQLVRNLVTVITTAYTAGVSAADTDSVAAAVAAGCAGSTGSRPVISLGQLAGLAGRMLRLVCDVTGAAERMGAYVRAGAQHTKQNDRRWLDQELNGLFKTVVKDVGHMQAVLQALHPTAALRLLLLHLANRHLLYNRPGTEARGAAAATTPLPVALAELAQYHEDDGISTPPQACSQLDPVPALDFIAANWEWSQRYLRFYDNFALSEGVAVYTLLLTDAARRADAARTIAAATCDASAAALPSLLCDQQKLQAAYSVISRRIADQNLAQEPYNLVLKAAVDNCLLKAAA